MSRGTVIPDPATNGRHEPRLEENKRLGRVLRIVQLVGANPKAWTRARLAGHFEVSTRQIDKDLEQIRHSLRFELRRSPTGYYFESGPLLKPVHLTIPEALALSLAAQQGRDTGAVERASAASALSKIEEALPAALAPDLRQAGAGGDPVPVAAPDARAATLATLQRARVESREVRCVYRTASGGGSLTERTLRPYELSPYHDSWMLVAHDSRRSSVRTFNVDRIISCRLSDERFEAPREFDLAAYLGPAWGVLRGQSGPVEDVVLCFSAEAAPWVRDTRWHYSQRTEEHPDGSLTMRFRCVVTNELVRWALSFGGRVDLLEPASLREAVAAEARDVVRNAARITAQAPAEASS